MLPMLRINAYHLRSTWISLKSNLLRWSRIEVTLYPNSIFRQPLIESNPLGICLVRMARSDLISQPSLLRPDFGVKFPMPNRALATVSTICPPVRGGRRASGTSVSFNFDEEWSERGQTSRDYRDSILDERPKKRTRFKPLCAISKKIDRAG